MNIEIANRLVELRKKNGYSQEELAEKLGLSRQAVSKWERAESSPDTDNLICLAKLYGVSLDELLNTDQSVEDIAAEKREQQDEKGGIWIKGDNGERVVIDDDGIRVMKDGEEKAVINEEGVVTKNTDNHPRHHHYIYDAIAVPIAVIAYILVGLFWKVGDINIGWRAGWVLILLALTVSSLIRAIHKKKVCEFLMPLLIVSVYVGGGLIGDAYGVNLWSPYWVEWFAVPVFYIVGGAIDHQRR